MACAYFGRDAKRRAVVLLWFGPLVKLGTTRGISTVAHEAVHAAVAVFSDRNIQITKETEEPFAYYHGWLFEEALRRLRP